MKYTLIFREILFEGVHVNGKKFLVVRMMNPSIFNLLLTFNFEGKKEGYSGTTSPNMMVKNSATFELAFDLIKILILYILRM